uniref:Homeobox domain-containing protein n=1 Tax=Panagrolaimus sp. ES5 TaxID=591445 RepID=A0AC34GYE1_9BILA
MINLQVLTGLLAAMQQQQQQKQLRMPHQQQPPQQQTPTPQQLAFNPFMAQMIPNLRFPFNPMMPPPTMSAPALTSSINDSNGRKMTPKVNKETAAPLQEWFDLHLDNPYPTEEDMRALKNITGFTDTQLGDWFRNKRRNYKKTHQGNVPWQIPTTTVRKRRASSISINQHDDSNSSPDSVSTAHSSPPLQPPRMPSTPTTSNPGMPSPSEYSSLLAALLTPQIPQNQRSSPQTSPEASSESSSSNNDDEHIDVETVEKESKSCVEVKQEPSENIKQEPSASSPPEKRIKLWSIGDLVQ